MQRAVATPNARQPARPALHQVRPRFPYFPVRAFAQQRQQCPALHQVFVGLDGARQRPLVNEEAQHEVVARDRAEELAQPLARAQTPADRGDHLLPHRVVADERDAAAVELAPRGGLRDVVHQRREAQRARARHLVRERLGQDLGDPRAQSVRTEAVYAELRRLYDVYFILPAAASYGGDPEVLDHWRRLLGQNVIELDDPGSVCETIALVVGLRSTTEPGALVVLLYLGVVPSALAYALFFAGLRTVPGAVASIVTLLEPLTATALATAFLGERLAPGALAGGLLVLAAVAGLYLRRMGDSNSRGVAPNPLSKRAP